jgi:circadian clock protein KaiC
VRELTENVRSLGFDLDQLEAAGKISVDHIHVARSEIHETGEYDLEGLFLRIGAAIDAVGAKRVVIDTIETLLGGLDNQGVLRAELQRLFRWLKDRNVTVVITGERGDGALTRQGLEEYVADCVILLDHRVDDQLSTRRLRIVKYRGTTHGTNEYPFLIDERGISVLPATSLLASQDAPRERIATGVAQLDAMLGDAGYYRGSSIMVTGTAGTGKTSLAAHFANAACSRGERVLYLAFEESRSQLLRNMESMGIDLGRWIDQGLLHVHASRPTLYGLESHLVLIHKLVRDVGPTVVIIDPLSNFTAAGTRYEVTAMLIRVIDFLKASGVTAFFTSITAGGAALENSELEVSSLIDTWLLLRTIEVAGERNRGIYVLKSRGMAHSNQIREFVITNHGIKLVDVYVGPEGVLTGSARLSQEARELAAAATRERAAHRRQRDLVRRRAILEAQIAALRVEFDAVSDDAELTAAEERADAESYRTERLAMATHRGTASSPGTGHPSQVVSPDSMPPSRP